MNKVIRTISLLGLLGMLGACATTVTVPEVQNVFPTPPSELMTPATPLKPLTPNADGSIDPQSALSTIIGNNASALTNATKLSELQNWILSTEANVSNSNKKPSNSPLSALTKSAKASK